MLSHERRVGRALAAAALVEEDDAVGLGVEEAAVLGLGAAAGPAVEEDHGLAVRVAGLFEVELVDFRDAQAADPVGLDLGIEGPAVGFHGGYYMASRVLGSGLEL